MDRKLKNGFLYVLSVVFLCSCAFDRPDRAPVEVATPAGGSGNYSPSKITPTSNKPVKIDKPIADDENAVVVNKLSSEDSFDSNAQHQTSEQNYVMESDKAIETESIVKKSKSSSVIAKSPIQTNELAKNDFARGGWYLPVANGKIAQKYTVASKGVEIKTNPNQPIYAVNSGKVVYSSDGIKGYGNVVIIQHADSYISVYAYNSKNIIKVGATVNKGQQIAVSGMKPSTTDNLLHFELRKSGKAINPADVINFPS